MPEVRALPELHTVVAEDGVGHRQVEVEVGHGELAHVVGEADVLSRHIGGGVAATPRGVDASRVQCLQEGQDLGDAGAEPSRELGWPFCCDGRISASASSSRLDVDVGAAGGFAPGASGGLEPGRRAVGPAFDEARGFAGAGPSRGERGEAERAPRGEAGPADGTLGDAGFRAPLALPRGEAGGDGIFSPAKQNRWGGESMGPQLADPP